MRILPVIFLVIFFTSVSRAEPPVRVLSPDKAFVVAWVDADTGRQAGRTRTITLSQLPHGDALFRLVSFPRYTKAVWSPDSKHCLIMDAPDNGNTNTWLFTVKDPVANSKAVRIEPMKTMEDFFEDHPDGHHLWRPSIWSISWIDNNTVQIQAWDNNGEYKITLKMDAPDKPVIDKIRGPGRGLEVYRP